MKKHNLNYFNTHKINNKMINKVNNISKEVK